MNKEKKKKSEDIHVRVLKELTSPTPTTFQWDIRESYAHIAKSLQVDEETIRIAIKDIQKSGLVQKWGLLLNPHLIGQKLAAIQLEVDEHDVNRKKSDVISQIKLIEGVVLVFDYHGKEVRVIFYFDSEQSLARKIKLIISICGSKTDKVIFWNSSYPHSSFRIRKTDWQILSVLWNDPRQNAADIAKEVRVSTRTVNRRLKLMTELKVFSLIPVRNIKNSTGLFCSFLILCPEEMKKEIDLLVNSIDRPVDYINARESKIYLVTLVFENIGKAEEFEGKIRALRDMEEVRMNIIKEFNFVDSWFDEVLQRELPRSS